MNNKIELAAKHISRAENITVLTGAGMSTESGIKDFRSKDGLSHTPFKGYFPEKILSQSFFYQNTELFYEYLHKYLFVENIKPNIGHELLVELGKKTNITIITQNVDSLHQKAGSKNVIELHGNLLYSYCDKCGRKLKTKEIFNSGYNCHCGGLYKPKVVLYDEPVSSFVKASKNAAESDLLMILGSSLTVFPAANIPSVYGIGRKPVIIINKEKTVYRNFSNVIEINSFIGKTLSKLRLK